MGEERTIALSRCGRFVACRSESGLDLVDALGTSPRRHLELDPIDFAYVGTMLWVLARGTGEIQRYAADGMRSLSPAIQVGAGARRILPSAGDRAVTALVTGERDLVVHGFGNEVSVVAIDATGALFPLGGRTLLAAAGAELRVVDAVRAPHLNEEGSA